MATVSNWNPFGVALDVTATASTVTRISATKYTVKINVSWETYYSGALTKYGMSAASGGVTYTISAFTGAKRSSGSGSFTGTYSISGNGSATKTITVTFRNFNTDNGDSATKNVTFNVTVPAWTSYTITYNPNGGSGAPGNQTKWKDQTLTLSKTEPTRTGYSFLGWSTSKTATSATYTAGGSYTANSAATLYAVWKANTYTIKYNANGGSGQPANQTKTYGVTLKLSTTEPTRTNYTFLGWSTSKTATSATYTAGGNYTANSAATLYAVWKLAYTEPKITNLSVVRWSSEDYASGNIDDSGAYAKVEFNWSTFYSDNKKVQIKWQSSVNSGSETLSVAGTSGLIRAFIGNGELSTEVSYTVTVTITDDGGSTSISKTLTGAKFAIDFLAGGTGVSIGKPAELENTFDVTWLSKFRDHVCIGEKTGYLDGKTGAFISNEGYMHLQRDTSKNYNPYIAFLRDDETEVSAQLQLDVDSNTLKLMGADDLYFGTKSHGGFKPYYTKGDTISISIKTAGYVTNASKDVGFTIPITKPIIGVSSVSVDGSFTLRQNTKYTHGSSAENAITSGFTTIASAKEYGIMVTASFTDITNVINNNAIGVNFIGTVTLS